MGWCSEPVDTAQYGFFQPFEPSATSWKAFNSKFDFTELTLAGKSGYPEPESRLSPP